MSSAQHKLTPAGGPGVENAHAHGDLRQSHRKRPAEGTARAAILAALKTGRSLTHVEALREFGTFRLAAAVYALRRMGWPIVAEEIQVPTRRGTSRVARYSLSPCYEEAN